LFRSTTQAVIFALVTAALVAGACGGGQSSPAPATSGPGGTGATAPPASQGAGGAGEINVSGSSTVEPVSLAVAEDFKADHADFGYRVEGPGTGDGFALFCAAETDVSDASRPIKDEEAQACADAGVNYVELKIAYDGLTVMTHPDTPIECLTFADLYALFGPESDNIATWKAAEALAHELGSTTTLPDLPLQITAPGEESGTYDAFIELTLATIAGEREQEDVLRVPGPTYTASANDHVIVEGVEAGAGSLGFVGFAFFEEAGDAVKALEIDGGDGCVAPTLETIADASYPISRPLFIYVNTDKAASNQALAEWVDFYLSDEGIQNASDVGYVMLPADELEASRQAWAGR
jgi:phosphate transport system substrate-binding protein